MITIQSGMLIALGFLAASLLGLLIAPVCWSRAVRLTTRRIKETMPLSEMEIEADRDRIRAEYAIKMHKLETLVEQVKLAGARQQIEINRRDARVNVLEGDIEKLRASYEEAQNARRVLEQTIADRLPKLERRLDEAKKVLFSRERELEELKRGSDQQVLALAEASALNAQRTSEIEQLKAELKQAQRPSGGTAPKGEAALISELEKLRAKVREQAQLISRLQQQASMGQPEHVVDGPGETDSNVVALRAQNDDQAGEIARLRAAIAVFERDAVADGKVGSHDTGIAVKAHTEAVEAQLAQQTETIVKLRGELAAANERLAQQASYFTAELKRLGGTGSGRSSRRGEAAAGRLSLADRVQQARSNGAGGEAAGEADTSQDAAPVGTAAAPGPAALSDDAASREGSEAGTAERDGSRRPRLLDRIAGLSRTP